MSKRTVKKIVAALLIIAAFALAKFAASLCLNEVFISNMNDGNYSDNLVKVLYILNLEEPYIAHYNDGIRYYKSEDYKNSESKFETALKNNPPEERICLIRINLSLSIVKQAKKGEISSYLTLERAKKVLYEDGCANQDDDNGKSEDAEKLEEEIKKLQEQQDEPPSDPGQDPPQDPGEEPDDPTRDIDIEDIEQQLRDGQIEALRGRQGDLGEYQEWGGDYYDGKKW